MALTVVGQLNQSPPGSVYTFKVYDPASGGSVLGTGANALVLTGFSPMDLTAPLWQASTLYIVGQLIQDSNGNIQRCTGAGTSGATHPVWATSSTTSDNSVTWTFYAAYRAPQYGNTVPDPYQVRLRAYGNTGIGTVAVTYASLDVATWVLSLTDTTQTTINCTIYVPANTAAVILEVPAT